MSATRLIRKNAIQLTAEGYALIEERLADLRERRIPELRPLLVEHDRDERNVAEFEALLAEEAALQATLAEAEVVPAVRKDGRVRLGSLVGVTLADGSTAWVRPVHAAEAALDDERISIGSPLGSAILGVFAGDKVTVEAPVGRWECTVLEVDGLRKPKRRR